MANKKRNITKWIADFKAGKFDNRRTEIQIKAGWYDWFCKDTSLRNKTKNLGAKLIRIADSKKFDNETSYVFFKNNCPMNGNLYDDFRICDIKTGDVLFTITPKSGHTSAKGQGEVWSRENDFDGPIITGTWKEIVAWFLTD